jgi:hypothetical protein
MKQGVFLLVVVLVALIYWLLNDKPQQKSPDSPKPNVLSFETTSTSDLPKTINNPKSTNSSQEDEAEFKVTIHQSTDVKTNDELSYLDVYRMIRKFSQCQNVIYRLLEDQTFNPIAEFKNRIKPYKDLNPHWPTNHQLEAVKQHSRTCQQLLAQLQSVDLPKAANIGVKKSLFIQLRDQLRQYLLVKKPNTAKEHAIADILSLKQIWQDHFDQVLEVSKGDETQNLEQIEALQEQIKLLQQERSELNLQHRENQSNDTNRRYTQIWFEISDLKKQITNLRLVDPEARSQAIEAFEVVNEMLFAQLKTRDPDVFFETQRTLEQNKYNIRFFGYSPHKNTGNGKYKVPFIEYVSPGEVIKNLIGIQDNEIFGLVINYATKLYHCELGADCGPEGEWIPDICHIGYQNIYEEACQSDLPSFYQQHLLNQNQWQDVQYVLSVIRGIYEN